MESLASKDSNLPHGEEVILNVDRNFMVRNNRLLRKERYTSAFNIVSIGDTFRVRGRLIRGGAIYDYLSKGRVMMKAKTMKKSCKPYHNHMADYEVAEKPTVCESCGEQLPMEEIRMGSYFHADCWKKNMAIERKRVDNERWNIRQQETEDE